MLLKPCSDERQNGFKLLKTKTKKFSALRTKHVHIHNKNFCKCLREFEKIYSGKIIKRGNCFNRENIVLIIL